MATETSKVPELTVAVVLPEAGLPRPEAVNFFSISRVGGEVQIMTAYIDLNQAAVLRQRLEKGEEPPRTLTALPMHRLAVPASAFAVLKHRVDEIYASLMNDGRIDSADKAEG